MLNAYAEKYDTGAETTRLLMNDYDAIGGLTLKGSVKRPIYSDARTKVPMTIYCNEAR